jgi:hypothetical protein
MKLIVIMLNLCALLCPFVALAHAHRPTHPRWVQRLITRLQSEPVRNPPAKILRYTHSRRSYYYVPPAAGDRFSALYNAAGKEICAPDGGITGMGDGKCPSFVRNMLSSREPGKVIWQDTREGTPSEAQKSGFKIQVE